MAGLLAPYIPDSSEWFKSAAQGYALGDTMRNRDLRIDAGGQAAEGDMAGAKATLYEGGDFEGGNQVHQMMRQASDDALKKTERFHSTLGNLALAADTPEKWNVSIDALSKAGMDVSKYRDFNTRQMVLAQSGKTIEAINMEAERRKAEATARKPIEMSPGATLYDPGTMKPVFTAPAKPTEKKFAFTKYGVGDSSTGDIKPYAAAGGGGDPGKLAQDQRWRMKNGALDLDASGRPIAEPIPGSSKAQPKPRNLSYNDTEKLAKKGVQLEGVTRYGETFKDEFSGYGRGGESAMWIARNLPILTGPTTEGAATWWQDYDRYKNTVRNELFGSALTTAEQAAFESADITPNMKPEIIRANLTRQKEATKSALAKTTTALTASGYNPEAVEGAVGVPLADLSNKGQGQLAKDEDAATSKELVQVTKEQYDALEPGERYLDPNGDIRTKAKK